MKLSEIINVLESIAPRMLQEKYDNAQLITGNPSMHITKALATLDCIESVVDEAIHKGCNLIISHHPIVFSEIKSLTGANYIEQTVMKAIKNDIAIYAMHTNLDNIYRGVNFKIAQKLGLLNTRILLPKQGVLKKLFTYVPKHHEEEVKLALFEAGAGSIGNYSECSFSSEGNGTFNGNESSNPFVGLKGNRHTEKEVKIEVIFENYKQIDILKALFSSHPYEEVAYEIIATENFHQQIGSGLIGDFSNEMAEDDFLNRVAQVFNCRSIKHTKKLNKPIKKVALCGGAGQFLLKQARKLKADAFISADFKYHEFFDAEDDIFLLDIGHYESEQFTPELFVDFLQEKFPTFAVLLSGVKTNPVHYFIS